MFANNSALCSSKPDVVFAKLPAAMGQDTLVSLGPAPNGCRSLARSCVQELNRRHLHVLEAAFPFRLKLVRTENRV